MLTSLLRAVGRLVPDVRYVRGAANRILIATHRRLALGGGIVEVLGFRMELDPRECVDSGLWFMPHLYDHKERAFARSELGEGLFVDVGSNIGFWSLYLARHFSSSDIIAIEANPATFAILQRNVELNGFERVECLNVGVGPEEGSFPLYLNETGNRGGDSFTIENAGRRAIDVPVRRLSALLAERGHRRIEFMKIDVEGMEVGVFSDLFAHLPEDIWPRYICAEVIHSPELADLLNRSGYRTVLECRENSIFRKA